MTPRSAAGILALIAALAAPVIAAPRLTDHAENLTLRETAAHLQSFYGWPVRLFEAGDSGSNVAAAALPLPTGPRASFDWHDATIGAVFRDVSRAFHVTPLLETGSVTLRPGLTPVRGMTVISAGVQVTLRTVEQSETTAAAPSGGGVDVSRQLTLTLAVRALDGDPDSIPGLERLRALDDRGNELRPSDVERIGRTPESRGGGFPDEWAARVELPGADPRAHRLEWIAGELLVYRHVQTRRIEIPLEPGGLRAPVAAGPSVGKVAITGISSYVEGATRRAEVSLSWPREVALGSVIGLEPGGVPVGFRLPDGSVVWEKTTVHDLEVDPSGTHSEELEAVAEGLPAAPTSVVLEITEKPLPVERVPFRFVQIPLPWRSAATIAAAARSGALQIRPGATGAAGSAGELSVGLSRQMPQGWTPFRWTALETDERGEARLDDLETGKYRVRLTFRVRRPDGKLGPMRMLPVPETLVITPGKTTSVPLSAR